MYYFMAMINNVFCLDARVIANASNNRQNSNTKKVSLFGPPCTCKL